MHFTDEIIRQALDEMKRLDIQQPAEALALCEETFKQVTTETDPGILLLLNYRKVYYMNLLGRGYDCLDDIQKIIADSKALGDELTLAKALNMQGNLYSQLGAFDRALESLLACLKVSERIGYFQMISNVSNNIGGLYDELGEFEKAESYYIRCLNSIDPLDESDASDRLRGVVYLNLSNIAIKRSDFSRAQEAIEHSKAYFSKHGDKIYTAHAWAVEAEIHQATDNEPLARSLYSDAAAVYQEFDDKHNILVAALPYVRYLFKKSEGGTRPDYLSEARELVVRAFSWARQVNNQKILVELLALKAEILEVGGDYLGALEAYKLLEIHRKALDEEGRQQQLNVLSTMFEIEKSIEEKELVKQKNQELREKSQELLEKKEDLEKAYNRIQLISEIGQKITSTLDLSEILLSVYENLKTQMPIDLFYMLMLNDERTHLVSVASVEDLVYERSFEVAIDNPNSLLALSFREQRTLFYPDVYQAEALRDWEFIKNSALDIHAVIVVPLLYDEEVVGVCSVQSVLPQGYDTSHVELMDALSTYLAIAFNNAQKSKRLEQEIQMRLRTQKELERLNAELRSISEIDGLTKVPNRRRFENVYDQMFEIALVQQHALHVMMMDIDYFKIYNDHYGHLKGDEVLIAVAQKLNQAFRFKGRLFARYGGEEFVAVLVEMTIEEALVLAQEMRIAISNLGIFHELSPTGFLTISIGLASMVPEGEKDMRRLLHAADESLYRAKNNGRNRVESIVLMRESDLEAELLE